MRLSNIVSNPATMKLLTFNRGTNGFNFVFEKELKAGESIIVKMPTVSANKRGINDIGWASDGDVTLYGTISKNPKDKDALYQEIRDNDDINKVISGFVVVNNGAACKIEMRAILN